MPRYIRTTHGSRNSSFKMRLVIAAGIALFSFISYLMKADVNEITGETQQVALTEQQEIALGLKAMPTILKRHHGEHPDQQAQAYVDRVGNRLLESLNNALRKQGRQNPYRFDFHLLNDDQVVNAFALPGGQIFITAALYDQLETEGQLAGVLGHEIGHVLSRHGAQQIAKRQLTQGLVGAAGVAGGDVSSAKMAQIIGSMVNMKYGRNDELESDRWGVEIMVLAGYDPYAMIGVMKILKRSAGAGRQPELFSTHPDPGNRIERIKEMIQRSYPPNTLSNLEP
ncbi:TPR repeat-containing protein YfgC precursor [Gimesia alba]|uniref:TPR repeat-containing protein YfgC n=1 Tax=Gimesia alba TaxID=2527973 RepID=A0A517REM2_9PLAN|nr:M48 family metalloprotease [Gimesia alba]QDT42300.1 TPR repeat-containing protein YfgC precursor [Gimesia alba]